MTTKVTVDAHSGWPVRVINEDSAPDGSTYHNEAGIVQPGEVRDFYVFDTRKLIISEMKKEV